MPHENPIGIKYTPAPWSCSFNKGGGFIVFDERDLMVIASRNIITHREDESHANGRLIVNAPDLLLACLKSERLLGQIQLGAFTSPAEECEKMRAILNSVIDRST